VLVALEKYIPTGCPPIPDIDDEAQAIDSVGSRDVCNWDFAAIAGRAGQPHGHDAFDAVDGSSQRRVKPR